MVSDLALYICTSPSFVGALVKFELITNGWQIARNYFRRLLPLLLVEHVSGSVIKLYCDCPQSLKAEGGVQAVKPEQKAGDDGIFYWWFCHFDDDNYVNVARLVRILGEYNPQEDWYLGKPSIRTPLEIINREPKARNKVSLYVTAIWWGTSCRRIFGLAYSHKKYTRRTTTKLVSYALKMMLTLGSKRQHTAALP
ncbi:hypothetical protein AAG570_000561 [Ranatra chinensis]|uniref:Fringe-like glycosyltransferase domain-containing protein n=1 Tax=Ranatra chinensis TaxID=642074 RepID=A0ABD0YY47_9HEMI